MTDEETVERLARLLAADEYEGGHLGGAEIVACVEEDMRRNGAALRRKVRALLTDLREGVGVQSKAETDLAVAAARAEAFDDAAAIVRMQHKHGTKCETEAEWLQASYTFSNAAWMIRRDNALPQPQVEPTPPAP